jgi:hypothetical protein
VPASIIDGRSEGHPVRLDNIFSAARQRIKDKLFGQENMIDCWR